MRLGRILVTLGLALVLATPMAASQAGSSIQTEALVGDQPISGASPLKPGTEISLATDVTSPDGQDTEWRAFVNASLDEEVNRSRTANWTGGQSQSLDASFQAPQKEGAHAIDWTVTVQSRNATADEAWATENSEDRSVGFRVLEPAPTPSPDDVSATVATSNGTTLDTLPEFTPSENLIVNASGSVPDVNRTDWRIQVAMSVNGTQVASQEIVRQGAGTFQFPLQFSAPSQAGDYPLSWSFDIDYRNETSSDWTNLTVKEGASQLTVRQLEAPSEPGLPWVWIIGLGAVAVGGGAGAYFLLREPKQIKGEPKSKAMQELEGAPAPETDDEPEVHPQLKILEARAEDVRRMIELAEERHERGDITEHQYEQIREKKEDELEEIQEEMDEYRREGGTA